MRQRLPLVVSLAALLVALLGSTPLGRAAESAIAQVVPRAKKADFAANSGKLNGHRSSVTPSRGQIPVVGPNGKLAASLGAIGPPGPPGAQGPPGPAGATGYQQRVVQIAIPGNSFRADNVDCPGGKSVLGAGHFFREEFAADLRVIESRPISDSTWRFKIQNATGGQKGGQSLYVVCATMSP